MSILTSTQTKILNKLFNRLGSTVVRFPLLESAPVTFGETGLAFPISFTGVTAGSSIDKWGDLTLSYDSASSIIAIPYGFITHDKIYEMFGNVQDGYTTMAFKHDQELTMFDKITFDSKSFFIKRIEKFPLLNGNLVKIALMYEDMSV